MKKWLVALIVFAVAAGLLHFVGWLDFQLNSRFILANSNALPLRYAISQGYGTGAWWAIGGSVLFGLLCVGYMFLPETPRRGRY